MITSRSRPTASCQHPTLSSVPEVALQARLWISAAELEQQGTALPSGVCSCHQSPARCCSGFPVARGRPLTHPHWVGAGLLPVPPRCSPPFNTCSAPGNLSLRPTCPVKVGSFREAGKLCCCAGERSTADTGSPFGKKPSCRRPGEAPLMCAK